jgi:excisionase family DNA binding protein
MTDDNNKTLDTSGPGEDWNPEPAPDKFASDGDLPLVLNATEVADLLRVSYRVIITMAKEGEIPAFQVAGQWRFSRSAILKWIDDISNEDYDPIMRSI